jgi:hypothetical protein
MSLQKHTVEYSAFERSEELGNPVGYGPHLAPGEPAAEEESIAEVVLGGHSREAIRRLNSGAREVTR